MIDIEIPLGKRTAKYRFFEILPAVLSYVFILLPIILSFINPFIAAIFIVGYIIMWFVKAIGMSYRTVQGYNSLEKAQKVDWQARLNDFEEVEASLKKHEVNPQKTEWRLDDHYRRLLTVSSRPKEFLRPSQVYNAVIIAVWNEGREVVEPTIKAVMASAIDHKNTILLIAYEGRGPEATHNMAKDLVKRYGQDCFAAVAVEHPSNLPNEIIGKGGNITFAGRYLQGLIEEKEINPERVIVTTLDCDNIVHPQYLPCLTYEYITNPHRTQRAFQPIALYLNNIWDVPAPMRILATGNSFWTIINSMRPHMLRNFASHSQGLESLLKTDFWSVRTIVEDGHQYWRSYFAFDGQYEVVPIYIPVYQDAVLAETYKKTIKAQFVQLRRWAYGVSDVAYVADKGFRKDRTVPFWGFWARFFRLLESHVSWASASIIITFGAWAPLIVNPEASRSIVAHELPQVASQLQMVAMVGMFMMIFLAFKMLPPRPERYKRHRTALMLAQWLIMPIVSIAYGSAAAINAQTRLMLGKYLDKFDLTAKVVKK